MAFQESKRLVQGNECLVRSLRRWQVDLTAELKIALKWLGKGKWPTAFRSKKSIIQDAEKNNAKSLNSNSPIIMMLKRLSIRYKLYFGFAVVAGVLIMVSVLAMVRFNEVRATIDELINMHQPSILSLKDAGIALQGAAGALGYFVVTRDPQLKEELQRQLATAQEALDSVRKTAGDRPSEAMAQALLELERQIQAASVASVEVLATTDSFEANYPGIAFANEQVNPLTRDLLQYSGDMLRSHDGFDQAEGQSDLLLAMADLRYSVSNVMRGIRGYLAFRNEGEIENNRLYFEQIDQLVSDLQANEERLSFEQTDYLERFQETLARFKTVYAELLRLHGSERWKQDAWLVRNQVLPLLAQVDAGMRELSDAQQSRVQASSTSLLQSAANTSRWVLGLAIAGVLVTALVGWILGRMIVSPIRAASHAMAQVAGGDGDLTRRLTSATRDELDELVGSFNAFAERIHELVKATARSTNAVISSVATTNESACKIADRIAEQHRDADQLATEIRGMVTSIAETAELATEGAESATSAARNAASGRSVVEETAAGIHQLGEKLAAAAEAIANLDQEAQTIGGVLDVIRNIADQTNLLALNAAIEAARAGESGRGFAVVASEVRSLANRTRESTGEIADMIMRLQTSAQETKTQMADGHRMAQGSVAQSESALGALESIATTVDHLRASNERIAAAAEQQRGSSELIRRTVELVNETSSETAREAEQTNKAAARLGDYAAELQGLIGKFKLADDDSLDFEAAKSAHLAWRARVRSFLDGRGSLQPAEALSHRDCMLGRWYYGPGLERYGHLDGMRALEAPHVALHESIAAIIQDKNNGDHRAAEEKYGELISLSEQIVGGLDELERSVAEPDRKAVVG